MLSNLFKIPLAAALLFASSLLAEDQPREPAKQLAEVDVQIKEQPDDPMLHYARAKLLARLAKYDDAYAAAQTAMDRFIAAKKELAWLMLDAFEAGGHKVTVHFNMGPDERRPPEAGIVRPL